MKKPWNLINPPIYSLASYNGEQVNMNICTYVTSISMKPKCYAIALYENTQTLALALRSTEVILQLLSTEHLKFIKTLGYKHGGLYDKQAYLTKNQALTVWQNRWVLANASAYLWLKKSSITPIGDHHLGIFEVLKYQTNSHQEILTLDHLRAHHLVRI